MKRKNRRRKQPEQANLNESIVVKNAVPESREGERTGPSKARKTVVTSLDSAILEVCYRYQRPTRPRDVQKIVDQFDSALVNLLKVSYRDGHYYVFDGAHTLAALKIVNGKDSFPVLCQLFYGLSYEEECCLFSMQHGCEHKVGVPYMLRAREEGADEKTMDFLERTRKNGFEIIPGNSHSQYGQISAVRCAYNAYEKLGPEAYEEILRIIQETWNGESWSVSQRMLSGMAIFYQKFKGDFREKRFLNKLGQVSKTAMAREASKYYNLSSSLAYAMAIGKIYNKGGGIGTVDLFRITETDVQDNGETEEIA